MRYRSTLTAACVAVCLVTSAEAQQAPASNQNCAPNPWVTGGFCERINPYNRYYCEWPCGTPPPLVRESADIGPFGRLTRRFFDRDNDQDQDAADLAQDQAPN
jgi:hypothetical protein